MVRGWQSITVTQRSTSLVNCLVKTWETSTQNKTVEHHPVPSVKRAREGKKKAFNNECVQGWQPRPPSLSLKTSSANYRRLIHSMTSRAAASARKWTKIRWKKWNVTLETPRDRRRLVVGGRRGEVSRSESETPSHEIRRPKKKSISFGTTKKMITTTNADRF